jgi:hypothetical protein
MKRSTPLLIMVIALSSCLLSAQRAWGSHSSTEASDLCRRLSSIRRIPFEHEAVNDEVYNKIIVKGKDVVRCLIDQLTNETKMADPRSEPTVADFRVGDLAFFLLLRITNVPFEQMLPDPVKAKLKEEGVYAYFRYTGTPGNRIALQRKWKAWLKAQTSKPQS